MKKTFVKYPLSYVCASTNTLFDEKVSELLTAADTRHKVYESQVITVRVKDGTSYGYMWIDMSKLEVTVVGGGTIEFDSVEAIYNYFPEALHPYMDSAANYVKNKQSNGKYKYTLTYWLNTATRDRRPTTEEDIENDLVVEQIQADSDYLACIQALCIINDDDDTDYYKSEYPDLASCIRAFDDTDFSDGSPFIVKLTRGRKSIYTGPVDPSIEFQ